MLCRFPRQAKRTSYCLPIVAFECEYDLWYSHDGLFMLRGRVRVRCAGLRSPGKICPNRVLSKRVIPPHPRPPPPVPRPPPLPGPPASPVPRPTTTLPVPPAPPENPPPFSADSKPIPAHSPHSPPPKPPASPKPAPYPPPPKPIPYPPPPKPAQPKPAPYPPPPPHRSAPPPPYPTRAQPHSMHSNRIRKPAQPLSTPQRHVFSGCFSSSFPHFVDRFPQGDFPPGNTLTVVKMLLRQGFRKNINPRSDRPGPYSTPGRPRITGRTFRRAKCRPRRCSGGGCASASGRVARAKNPEKRTHCHARASRRTPLDHTKCRPSGLGPGTKPPARWGVSGRVGGIRGSK